MPESVLLTARSSSRARVRIPPEAHALIMVVASFGCVQILALVNANPTADRYDCPIVPAAPSAMHSAGNVWAHALRHMAARVCVNALPAPFHARTRTVGKK